MVDRFANVSLHKQSCACTNIHRKSRKNMGDLLTFNLNFLDQSRIAMTSTSIEYKNEFSYVREQSIGNSETNFPLLATDWSG